ncbi:S8 family serine peptidase [Thalassiella azotivora]
MPSKRRTPQSAGGRGRSRAESDRADRAGSQDGGGSPWEPIFRSPGDDVVPGELLLTLTRTASRAMTESVPLHPLGPGATGPTRLGVPDVDDALEAVGVREVVRLALPSTGVAETVVGHTTGTLDTVDQPLTRSFRVRVDGDDLDAAVQRLEGLGEVEVVEPNRYRETLASPDDPRYPQQWGLPKINAPAAWERTTGDPSVVVAVVDSGCDLDHPDLAPLLVPGQDMVDLGPSPTPPPGFRFEGDFSGRDAVPDDEVGHGTHVAGTIAAASNNALGVAGVTWSCRIMPVKALTRIVRISDGQVRGVGSSADVAAAVRWAADHGASVINMSLGSPSPTTVERNAVAYAVGKGCVVVAAMGNDGSADPSYPAAYPDVVSVGAIDSADKRASFSQTGSHIDVVAPGVGIWSTYPDDSYASLTGTSMACPHVAGVAALVRSVKPAATVAEVADVLRTTARPLRDDPSDAVPNDRYGHGCVDARAAVDKASPVIGPVLRTPFLPCLPRTLQVRDCFTLRTVIGPQCPPIRSVQEPCWPRSPLCPPTTLPTTVPPTTFPTTTFPTTVTTLPPTFGPGGRGAGAAGTYDPYGLTGHGYGGAAQGQGQGPAEAATGAPGDGQDTASWQAGYEAGYAAGVAASGGDAAAARLPQSLLCPVPTLKPVDCPPGLPSALWDCPPPTVTFEDCPPRRTTFAPACPPRTADWWCPPPHTVVDPACFRVEPPTWNAPWEGAQAQGPGDVIGPPLTIRLRTPVIDCPPITWPPRTLPWTGCPPRTLPWTGCPPRTLPWTGCPVTVPTVPPTVPPTLPTTPPPPPPWQPGPGMQAAGPADAEGPGDVIGVPLTPQLRTPLLSCWPRTVLVRDCWWPRTLHWTGCRPRTVFEPECQPVPTPTLTITITPTTPQTGPGGGFAGGTGTGWTGQGYGYDPYGGNDPYGQTPFGG